MEASGWAYTEALSELYPTRADVAAEIAELEGRLTLPRSTELFASDIHGEYNAFSHVLRGGSGAVRALIEDVFGSTLNDDEKAALLALACYPAEHCAYALGHVEDADAWLAEAAARLAKIARRAAGDRTIDEVRALLPDDLAIAEELVAGRSTPARQPYREAIIESLVASGEGPALLEVLGALIQHLVVDQLHLIGDVYDRGPAPQLIMDELLSYPNVDVQWGNHDILWMGAAAGSPGSVANVVRICARYGNLSILEDAYGINLRPLATFAADAYANDPCAAFALKGNPGLSEAETRLTEKVQKAMAVIQFKVEAALIAENPSFGLDDRNLLHLIDRKPSSWTASSTSCWTQPSPPSTGTTPTASPRTRPLSSSSCAPRSPAASACSATCAFSWIGAACTRSRTATSCCTPACPWPTTDRFWK